MNALQTSNSMQIVAVVFCNLNQKTLDFTSQENPYFYLDLLNCQVGEHALVHNGADFGVVKVVRVLPPFEHAAALRVTKPLLCKINYDKDLLGNVTAKLVDFRAATVDQRVQDNIDRVLDKGVGTSTPQTTARSIGGGREIYYDKKAPQGHYLNPETDEIDEFE